MEDYNRDGKLFAEGLAKIIANVADGECSITTVNNGIFISGATNDQWLRISNDGSVEFGIPG